MNPSKWKISIWISLLFLAALPEIVMGQTGFDRINNYCNNQIKSSHRAILADSQRILFAGVTFKDSATNICEGLVSYIGAYDYIGNQLWNKRLNFHNTIFKSNETNSTNTLTKIAPNQYALTINGYDCGFPYSYSHAAIYIYNENGDSIAFHEMPALNNTEFNAPYCIRLDSQHNMLIAGAYISHPTSDSIIPWLAKFNNNGQFIWKKKLIGGDYDETYTSLATKILIGNRPNEYLVTGKKLYLDSALHKTEDAIWKTDTAGNVLWQRNLPKFPGWIPDFQDDGFLVFDVINASNGSGYYFSASAPIRYHTPGETEDGYRGVYYCGKLNEEGQVIWAKTYEGDTLRSDSPTGIAQQRNGDLLIMGSTQDLLPNPEISGSTLLCIDSIGNAKWFKVYQHYKCSNLQPEQTLVSISVAPNGGIVRGGGISQMSPTIGCWDSAGDISWIIYTDSMGRLNPNDTLSYPIKETLIDYNATSILSPKIESVTFQLFPNPTKDKLHLNLSNFKGNQSELSIEIYDYTGKKIYHRKLQSLKEAIDIKHFQNGLYLIKLTNNGLNIGVQKLIKQ